MRTWHLLAVLPELRAYTNGREVLLAYEKDIGALINSACENNPDSDAMVLAKAAKLICTEIFQQQNNYKFSGTFISECQTRSVPDMLLSLVRMILEGVSITSHETSENGRCKAAHS